MISLFQATIHVFFIKFYINTAAKSVAINLNKDKKYLNQFFLSRDEIYQAKIRLFRYCLQSSFKVRSKFVQSSLKVRSKFVQSSFKGIQTFFMKYFFVLPSYFFFFDRENTHRVRNFSD